MYICIYVLRLGLAGLSLVLFVVDSRLFELLLEKLFCVEPNRGRGSFWELEQGW
jgi:hypothetical protein